MNRTTLIINLAYFAALTIAVAAYWAGVPAPTAAGAVAWAVIASACIVPMLSMLVVVTVRSEDDTEWEDYQCQFE